MSELLPDCKLNVFGNHSTSFRPRGQSMVLLRFMYSLVGKAGGGDATRTEGTVQGGKYSWMGPTRRGDVSAGVCVLS